MRLDQFEMVTQTCPWKLFIFGILSEENWELGHMGSSLVASVIL